MPAIAAKNGNIPGKLIVFTLGQAKRQPKGEIIETKPLRSAPHYFEATIPRQFIVNSEKQTIKDREVEFQIKTYPPDILIVEAGVDIDHIFFEDVLDLKDAIMEACDLVLEKAGGKKEWSEEYAVLAISGYTGDPEQFFQWKDKIAGFLKSEKLQLDEREITQTLEAQIKYAKNDLVIIDWDGAFIFDPEADFASTVELLELANYQLLKYRLLDSELDERLAKVDKIFRQLPEKKTFIFGGGEVQSALKSIIKIRTTSIFEFQGLERDIKLIGDWYSARLYELAAKKFKFSEWRNQVKEKLEAIEDIYSIASERFSFSPERIEMIGWFVLLAGWAIILVFDLWVAFFK
ncbi:MAG: hypothetical protein Q7S34_00185 [bacterium]|nr:hypothetical protein [bacterium]